MPSLSNNLSHTFPSACFYVSGLLFQAYCLLRSQISDIGAGAGYGYEPGQTGEGNIRVILKQQPMARRHPLDAGNDPFVTYRLQKSRRPLIHDQLRTASFTTGTSVITARIRTAAAPRLFSISTLLPNTSRAAAPVACPNPRHHFPQIS